jgi:hypothetical protein
MGAFDLVGSGRSSLNEERTEIALGPILSCMQPDHDVAVIGAVAAWRSAHFDLDDYRFTRLGPKVESSPRTSS